MDERKDPGWIRGVIIPAFTPVDDEERVDEIAYRSVLRRCLKGGADGIFAGGSAGLGHLLSDREWERALEIAFDEVGGRVLLMGGVIATTTALAKERIQILDRIGFSTMAVTTTFPMALERDEEFLVHFGACREATDIEMVIYNMPSCVASSIPLRVVRDMVDRGWATTCKESSGDTVYFRSLLEDTREGSLVLLQGNEVDIAWSLQEGAHGMIPACGNYAPEIFAQAWQLAEEGRWEELLAVQSEINSVREVLLLGEKNRLSGISYGLHTLGIGSGRTIAPFQAIGAEEKSRIDAMTGRRNSEIIA